MFMVFSSETSFQILFHFTLPVAMSPILDECLFCACILQPPFGQMPKASEPISRSAVYKNDANSSQVSQSSTVEEITRQVREVVTQEIEQKLTSEIEQRLTEKFKAEFEQMRAWMDLMGPQGGTNGVQIPDASSGHRLLRESVGDDTHADDLMGSDIPLNEQVLDKDLDGILIN